MSHEINALIPAQPHVGYTSYICDTVEFSLKINFLVAMNIVLVINGPACVCYAFPKLKEIFFKNM